MKSSYSCSVMMMMMESWSRAVEVVFSFRSRSVVDLTSSVVDLSSSVVDAVVSSKRSSNAVLSFSSIITSLSRLFDFEVRYESPIPGMMIPVARAHLMMMAAFAVAFCYSSSVKDGEA